MKEIIDRLLELEAKATPGPWSFEAHPIPNSNRCNFNFLSCEGFILKNYGGEVSANVNNALLIDGMLSNIRPLLLRMKALEDVAEACNEAEHRGIYLPFYLQEALSKLDECGK